MDDAEARAILTEHGEEPPKRGRLAPRWHDLAETYRADAPPRGDDYDDPDVANAFNESVTEAASPPMEPERRPRRPARKSLADRVRGATKPDPKAKAKKRHPRVPVDGLISSAWGAMGGAAMQIDRPLGMCLTMQAPEAGAVFENMVRGTVADRALQPIARVEEKAKEAAAILLPPLCVAGLEMAQRYPEPQRRAREAILWPMLIEGLVMGERVAGKYAEQITQRVQAEAGARERAQVLARAIFGESAEEHMPPPVPEPAESVA